MDDMKSETLYILIVTHNAERWLATCCHKAEELPHCWQIIVVDNSSSDETTKIIKKDYPHICLIESKENLGFGRANNLGLKMALEAGADYVFLLNQDASISIEAIQELIALHKEHPECLILSPVHLNGAGDELDHAFGRLCAPPSCPKLILDGLQGKTRKIYHTENGIAAAWLLARETLTMIGGFNPLFYHYGEDEDYVNRVLFHGYKAGVATGVFARHNREQRPRKKAVDTKFIDRLIDMTNPARPAPSRGRIAWSFVRPLCKALAKGNFGLAGFLMRSCGAFIRGGKNRIEYRNRASGKKPDFL